MEKIDKYSTSHPLLKQIVASIVFWRRSPDEKDVRIFLPNNIGGFGFTLSGELFVKKDQVFQKMPAFGTRNILDKSSEVKTKGNFLNISIRFSMPYGLYLFTKFPMNLVYEKEGFSLIDIFGKREIESITKKLLSTKTDRKKLEIIEDFLVAKMVNTCPPLLTDIVNSIHKSNGGHNVAELAKQFSTSERTINRYFNKYVGINPIEYINLIRFRSVINSKGDDPFTNALEAGYYDQSHFIKHFKEFSKVTPSRFFNSGANNDLSDFYNL